MISLTVICAIIIAAEISWIIKFIRRDTSNEKIGTKYDDWEG